jgi:hypothetical protein
MGFLLARDSALESVAEPFALIEVDVAVALSDFGAFGSEFGGAVR